MILDVGVMVIAAGFIWC